MSIRLIADTRERNVLRHQSVFAECTLEVRQITTGDYVVASDRVLAVIERKSLEDFASSLKDGRHDNKNKLITFRAQTGCRIVYIIEGPEFPLPTDCFGNIPYKHIESSIFHMMIRDGICVIRTKDTLSTAKTLVRFCNSMGSLMKQLPTTELITPSLPASSTALHEENTPYINPIIGAEELNNLLTEIKEKSTEEIVRSLWSSFPGISVESSSEFMRVWSIADIVCGRIPREDIIVMKTATGKAINKKVTASLINVPLNVCIRLLSNIPGVSIDTAKKLLLNTTLSAFISQGADGMEMFMIPGKIRVGLETKARRLGPKCAKKIEECFNFTVKVPVNVDH